MPPHAGYAAAIAVGQEVFQGVFRLLHKADVLPHDLATPPIPIPNAYGGGTLTLDFFLDVPTVTCADGTGDRLTLDLNAWGPMSLNPAAGAEVDRLARIAIRVLVQPSFQLLPETQQLRLQLAAAEATVPTFDFRVDQPLPPLAEAFLISNEFRALVELGVRSVLGAVQNSIPPLDVSYLGAITKQSTAQVTATRVRNGFLALGLDAQIDGVQTAGDPGALIDFRAGEDIGNYLNPVTVPVVFAGVSESIREGVADADSQLDHFSMALEEGHLHIAVEASNWQGSQSFSMNAVPPLRRAEARSR